MRRSPLQEESKCGQFVVLTSEGSPMNTDRSPENVRLIACELVDPFVHILLKGELHENDHAPQKSPHFCSPLYSIVNVQRLVVNILQPVIRPSIIRHHKSHTQCAKPESSKVAVSSPCSDTRANVMVS